MTQDEILEVVTPANPLKERSRVVPESAEEMFEQGEVAVQKLSDNFQDWLDNVINECDSLVSELATGDDKQESCRELMDAMHNLRGTCGNFEAYELATVAKSLYRLLDAGINVVITAEGQAILQLHFATLRRLRSDLGSSEVDDTISNVLNDLSVAVDKIVGD